MPATVTENATEVTLTLADNGLKAVEAAAAARRSFKAGAGRRAVTLAAAGDIAGAIREQQKALEK